ncbi:MAG: ribulokinase [Cyclobacteriaceae bacterium]
MSKQYVIGLDYGTDSVRALLVDTSDGSTKATSVHYYKRWKEGKFCDPASSRFRQHLLDHIEGLESTIKNVLKDSGVEKDAVKGICIDTTGSSPLAVNKEGKALCLTPGFETNPNAMMVLWKDHTSIREADEINELSKSWGGIDYTKYEGGIYSSEWFWAKILHVIREDEAVREAGGGLPADDFLAQLDPHLVEVKKNLYEETYTSDEVAGTLSPEWAERLGLSEDTVIAVGTFDAHAGAVGAEVEEKTRVRVMGTSTCDIIVSPDDVVGDSTIKGICGQVDGSVIPGMIGLEAGQSAFGDVLAWFRDVVSWPLDHLDHQLSADQVEKLREAIIPNLSSQAERVPLNESVPVALDWINGRRTPDANQALKAAIMNLDLGTKAPEIFRALVEAICFGSRKIVERFVDEGVAINTVVGIGGVAKKSAFIMQTLADVLNMPIKVATSEQAPALGAAMYAAAASGIYNSVDQASKAMSNGFDRVYEPQPEQVKIYDQVYKRYSGLAEFMEDQID